MKKITRILCAVLALLLAGGAAAGCERGPSDATEAPTAAETVPEPAPLLVCSAEEAPFIVVRSEFADETVKAAASLVRRTLIELSGNEEIGIREDWVKDGGPVENDLCEILVGTTNRVESAQAAAGLPRVLDYSISVIGKKICIYAADSDRVTAAVEHFLSLLKVEESGEEGKGKTVTFEAPSSAIIVSPDYPLGNTLLGGKPLSAAKIVIPAGAGTHESTLAERLALYLSRATGILPPVVTDASPASGAEIVIGATNRGAVSGSIPAGSFTVRLVGSTLFVQATDPGALFGAAPQIEEVLETPGRLDADFTETLNAGISLDGKRVMFIGNSMLYYGNCVINGAQDAADLGYFYQLCRANGEKCVVTDCTFGSHGLREFIGKCDAGHHATQIDHLSAYDLATYDYVVMCQVTATDELSAVCRQIMKRFPNPKTKFIYLCCTYTYQQNHTNMMSQLPLLQKLGITVVNVGELCYNIWKGNTPVPGSKLTYNKSSFIVNKKDQNHPNMLTGYIEALMCYCAITGRSAVGQPTAFATDTAINGAFSAKDFISNYYTPNSTNFDKVFASAVDMEGIQRLVDETNAKWGANTGIAQ